MGSSKSGTGMANNDQLDPLIDRLAPLVFINKH